MCRGCWEEYGAPAIVNDRTIRGAELIDAVYAVEPVGGNLHVVVDDWNLEDEHIQYCLGGPLKPLLEVEEDCGRHLLSLTLDERAAAMAIHQGFLSKETK